MTTDKPEFREHLASFALDQLWRLYVETWAATASLAEQAGIGSTEDLGWDEIEPVINRLTSLGKVPLVRSHEWNLTHTGHFPSRTHQGQNHLPSAPDPRSPAPEGGSEPFGYAMASLALTQEGEADHHNDKEQATWF